MDKFASSSRARLFLATIPDAATAERIHRLASVLKRAHKFDGKLIAPERLHISLFSLNGLPDRQLCSACEAATELRAEPFEVSFDRTVSFRGRPGSRPLVLIGENGLRRLEAFRQMLGAALTRRGLRRAASTNFTPHITLLYDARSVDEHPIQPIFWAVTEFVLIHSMKGHDYLARWPLRA
ncbi:RNA 2',3'-cyclic phosphodiesterase [Bradyrhizobium sp. CSA112]|uniref:2'-5' RNA ligase family protein n=1 Tax=Bradyrhizobium sp. CSA112 TaxID=2699170 RepID=UPI0023AF6444|nr:2'-5' RNA ligase family protein [Bradyrhizobium sp. CSA112]MDE5452062.1 RNA 2',3'-cyclic phosphodiesterase [Bradyrhizobium sp. CSA112]